MEQLSLQLNYLKRIIAKANCLFNKTLVAAAAAGLLGNLSKISISINEYEFPGQLFASGGLKCFKKCVVNVQHSLYFYVSSFMN